MNAVGVQAMRSGRSVVLIGGWQNPTEQIRKLANLLMLLSMLVSMVSPIYQPATSSVRPSFAFPDELRAFTELAARPETTAAPPVAFAPQPAGSRLATARAGAETRAENVAAATRSSAFASVADVLGSAIAPAWYGAPAHPESSVAPAELLGGEFAPSWFEAATTAAPFAAEGAASASATQAVDLLGSSLLPTWYAAPDEARFEAVARSSAGGSDFESIFFRPLQQEGADQCASSGNVMALVTPPYPVSRGNIYGDVYTVTVRNDSTVLTTTNVTVRIDPNVGFYYLGGSAAVESNLKGSLTYTDSGAGLPGDVAFIAVTGDITQTTLAPGEIMTFTFKLATDGNAESAQLLEVRLYSGATYCAVGQVQNVQTVRGNLTVQKSPNIRSAWLGDVLSWTVTLRNTGLGTVYHAQVTDTFGAGYVGADLSQLPTAPITLEAGASATYYVTGTVNACRELTNTAKAWWSIGNQDATATITDPASSQVDVRFNLVNPSVSLQVSPGNINIPFCTPLTQTVTITATASEAAKNVQILANTQSFSVSNVSAGWQYTSGVFTYVGGAPAGVMYKDQPITLTFDLVGPTACTTSNNTLSFRPTYQNACDVSFNGASVSAPAITYAADRPTLSVTQYAPYAVRSRGAFTYVVTVDATNLQNITDTIFVTDVVPAVFRIDSVSVLSGSAVISGQQIYWSIDTPGSGNLSTSMEIAVTVREDEACQAYSQQQNVVSATAPTCPQCGLLQAESIGYTYIEDVDAPLIGTKTVSGDREVCGATGFLYDNSFYVNLPVSTTSLIFTETLGTAAGFVGLATPLTYQTGTLSVTLNGIDATSLVTIVQQTPDLVVDMSRLTELVADVEITKTSAPAAVNAGDSVTYTLIVTNHGAAVASNVFVSDAIPAGLTNVTASASQGSCTTAVACALGSLAAGASAVITIEATVNTAQAADIVNVAYVTHDGLDNDIARNQVLARTQVTATSPLTATDLSIGKVGAPPEVTAGDTVTYTVVVTNAGPYTASNIVVVDALPFSFTLASATSSQGTCSGAHPLTCALGELAVGVTATITVMAAADASVTANAVNTAQVVADNPDNNLANNAATAATRVIRRLPLVIQYRVVASGEALGGDVSRSWHDWSLLYVDGIGEGSCRGNNTLYMGAPTTIYRSDLGIDISTGTPNACEPQMVTLNVTGGSTNALADNLVVTLTLGANDVYTVAGYGGFFATNPPSTVISNGNRITWTWDTALPITANGSINVQVLRPCAATGNLTAQTSFQDRCDATHPASAVNSYTPTKPELYLFLTPAQYEVVDKTAVWTVYVINTGDGDAVNALITNTLGAGLAFSRSVISGPTGVITTTGVGDGNDVQWLAPRLGVGQQMRIDVYADVIACGGLTMQAFADASCLSGTCSAVGPQSISLLRSPAALLSSNRQVAVLPMCESGPIELIVQNASAGATEYNFVITETVRYATILTETLRLTVTNRAGTVITATSAFTPVITTDGYTQTMVWNSDNLAPNDPLRTILDERAAGDIIRIGFLVQSDCYSADQAQVQSKVTAVEACQAQLTANESAVTLNVGEPELEVTKLMRNLTVGGGYKSSNVYAGAGDTVVYQVTVRNRGQQQVTHLFVEDQLPPTFELTSLSPLTSSQSGSPPLLRWHEGQTVTLQVNEIVNYYITGTISANACNLPNTTNQAWAYYGCSADFNGVCAAASGSVTTTFSTSPSLSLSTPAVTIDQCSGGPIVVNFPNNGARAENVVITYTLPPGLAYNGLASGVYPTPTISPSIGATGAITWFYPVIGQEVTTNTLRFNVINAAGVCAASGLITGTAQLGYEDSCGNPRADVAASATDITVQQSSIAVGLTPVARAVVVGQLYTWTVTITNSGNAPTNNLLVTATVGNGWEMVAGTVGNPGGAVPLTTTGSVRWAVGALAANNTTWTATYSARALDAASDYRTVVTATTACADGGCLQSDSFTAYDTPINAFIKTLTPASATIGDLVTFTVRADLFGNVPYTSTIVTDSLPTGLGYVAATLYVDTDIDGSPTSQLLPPTSAPAAFASGAIVWSVGNLTGAAAMTGVITAVVQNLITTTFQSNVLTNTAQLTYGDDGQPYAFADSAAMTVTEPILHIGKRYVTAEVCSAALFEENFNDGVADGWTTSGGAWSVVGNAYRVTTSGAATARAGATTWSDYSYSAMLSSSDTDGGDIGLIFRAQSATQYYRFRWNRNAAGNAGSYVVERVNGGVAAIGSATGSYYDLNRWYHVEVRVSGSRFLVLIDGALALDVTDPAPIWSTGNVGFYADAQSAAFFDNVLVTRYDEAGCSVGAGELITYTITISNQGMAMGRDLVITDAIPTGTSLHTYTFASNDPAAAITGAPATIPGATGVLLWTVNHLTATTPFNPLSHSWAVITVTARVLGDVSAGVRLSNQALLAYSSQAGDGAVGVERSYSGGSHSAAVRTADATLIKSTYPTTVTIGETFRYTLTFPGASSGIAANLYTATVTDSLPGGFRMVGLPAVTVDPPANIDPAAIDVTRSTTKTALIDVTAIPSYTQVTAVITAVVENVAANQDSVRYTNTATLGWYDRAGAGVTPVTSNPVTTDLVEPLLIIEKSAYPTNVRPGDTVFYTLRIYHAPTSTVPAYNVLISDTLNAYLSYISGSWEANNDPYSLAATGRYTVELPNLQAYFSVIGAAQTVANPLILRYQAVVEIDTPASTIITNVADVQWTSLLSDTYSQGEIRNGSGGVNDYYAEDDAQVSLDQFTITKSGPLTVTAGSLVTYVIQVSNGSPITGRNAYVVDTISFRVSEVTGTFSTPINAGLCNPPVGVAQGSAITCQFGDLPPNSTGVVTITGRIDPETPDGALVDDYAQFFITDSNGVQQERSDAAESQVETSTDLAIQKDGPTTANAGELITYTLVVTNVGPSTARGVDAKDILPDGLTFVAGSITQGACTSSICQIGDMQPGDVVTMGIIASVGSNVTGVITNTGQVFSATDDPNQSNNRDTATTTVSAFTTIHVAKVDMTDPVYAGNTYFYQVTVTNTGPAQANNVVITDILPAHVIFEGASPGCTYAAGRVTCAAGDLVPGEWFGVLINVRVPVTITDGTRVTNTATITTSTSVLAGSVLTATEPTLLLQAVNNPTDLAIAKRVTPGSVTAGLSGGNLVTYTLNITNTGLATTTAVQVTDFYPQHFSLLSATTSLPAQRAQCSNGGVCAIDELGIGEAAVITLTFSVPANVAADIYTNTAHVSSASEETNLTNNTASAPVTVLNSVTLQIAKLAAPNPATPGSDLNYTILITNTGPSDATNVTVSDTLPAGFTPDVILSSQGGCTGFPCNLGALAPNTHAWVTINGRIASSVTSAGQISNTARVTSTQTPVAVTASVTPTIALVADVGVTKQGPATAYPGASVVYTLTVRNLGPSVATDTRITDVVPAGLTFVSVSGCTNLGSSNQVVCALGDLSAGAVQTILVTATVDGNVYPGASLENVVDVTTTSTDNNLLNNRADADTTVLGAADITINKTQITANPITAGDLVTYTITINNTGPGMARAVDVKDQLPAGLTLERITASDGGVCGGTVCQFGDLSVNASRTVTVVAKVASNVTASSLTNTAGVYAVDDTTPGTDSAVTNLATSADVAVTKVDLNDPVGPTEEVLYQIVVVNNGPSDAQNVVVTDTLDANVSFVNASSGCALNGSAVVCTVGALAANASASYLLAVRASDVATGTVVTNSVLVTTTTSDPAPANNSASVTTTVQQQFGSAADVGIAKNGSASVIAGNTVTYTLTVTNAGPQTATNVRVLELVPAGTTVVSLTPVNPDADGEYCSLGGSCYLGTVNPGTAAVITAVLRVNSDYTGGSLVNSAQVSADQRDPVQANNHDDATTTVSTAADLAIAKTSLMNPAYAGQEILYQIVVTNTGPSGARNVVITDTLPTGASYIGASLFCTENAGVVRCEVGDLAAGATTSVFIQVRASSNFPDGAIVTNTVRTRSDTPDPVSGNDAYTTTTTVNQSAGGGVDLAIAKRATSSVVAGENVTYTLVITNNGPATAIAVSVVDALPAGVDFVSATASNGATCNGGVTCLLGDLGVDETVTITIVGEVASDTPAGSLLNRAQVASANPDSNPNNNTASASTGVTVDDQLSIRKVGPATAQPEQAIAYQIMVSNTGASDATNVVVSDTLPTGVENAIASASKGTCTIAAGLLTCTIGRLAAGEQLFIAVNGLVARNASGNLVNTARVTSAADPTGVSDTATTAVTASADLLLVKQAPATARPGDTLVYTLTLRNLGPGTAANVILTDTLPAGVTFSSATAGCGESGGVVTCAVGSLNADTTQVYTVAATVNSDVYPGTSLENVATVTTATSDPNPLNNTATADTSIVGAASFAIAKQQAQPVGAVAAGDLVTYTITFTNTGPGTARMVDVKDHLPSGLTLVSASAGVYGFCTGALCQFGSLPVGATRTMTVVAEVASALNTDVVTNVAAVYSVDAGGAATATVTTPITTAANLSVSKTALNNPVNAGGVAFFQIVVMNTGPSDAQNVVVTDTLPVSTTYAGGDAACSAADRIITCAIGALPAGASRTLLVQAHVDRLAADGLSLTNLVTATSPTPGAPVTATAAITIVQPTGGDADLALRKDGPPAVMAGERITYTLVVTNYGPADATDVQVADALPEGVRFVDAVASQGVCAAGVSCQLATLPLAATATITVVGIVESNVISGATLVNVARVDAANADPVSGNNQATASADVQAVAQLRLVKDASPATTTPGAALTYRIVVTNSGPSTARTVVVTDNLPAELSNATVSSSQGACTGFPCALGDIAPGGSATILVNATVAPGVTALFTNSASLSTATVLADGSATSDDATVNVTALADLLLILASTPTTIAGESAIVTATVSNLGPSVAEGAVVTITLPPGASYSAANLPTAWYVAAVVGDSVVLTTSDPLTANTTVALPITVNISATVPPGSSLQFSGEVGAATGDPNLTNNRSDADLSVIGQADLVVSKAGPATVTAGEQLTYTVLVTNTGPTAAVLRDLKDTLPAGVSLVSAILTRRDGSTTACAAGICQAAGTLAVDEVVTMTVVGLAPANIPAGSVLTNTATAFTDGVTPDPNPANNQASVATTVETAATLRATKVAFNNPVYAGDVIFYQIVVYNDGPSDAQNVVITDTLPVSTTYVGGDVACTHAAGVVTCNLGTLAANGSRTLQVQVRADAATAHGLIVTNQVTATSPTASTPATATVAVTIQQPLFGAVDLVIDKAGPVTATAGTLVTYTLVITNRGTGIANAVQIVDALPYEIIGLSVNSSQGVCNNSVVCQLGDLAAQASASVTITGWVRTETISGTAVLNTATVSSNNIELTPADNVDTLTMTIGAAVLMTIEKTAQPSVVAPGSALSYRILVRNIGSSLARNVVMTDLLPVELESPQLSSTRGYCIADTCYLGDVPPGEIVTILVLGNASLAATVSFTNTALLTTTTALDPASVMQAQVRTDVGDNADLIIFKWAPATVSAGSPISYILTVRNAGPSTAVAVQVQDALPPSVIVADFGGCVSSGPTAVLCPPTAIPTLTAGAEISWTLVVSTNSDLPVGATLQNRATVYSETPDPNPVNNSTSVETSIIGRSDLGVRKVASSPAVAAGSELTYTIVLTNGGPSDATSVRLVDILPSEVRLLHPIAVERSLLPDVPVICLDTVCETGMVEEGEIVTFTLHVLVNPAVAHLTVFTNTATVYSPSDPDFSNNVARTPVLAERESTLLITKRATPDPAITGAPLTYQIVVHNNGPGTADGVLVGDLLPAGFTVTSVSSSQGACSSLPCAVGSLPPGGEATITVVGVVDPLQAAPLVNTAAVTASTPLTNTDLSWVTITTTVSALANLSLLLDSTPTAIAGLTATVQAQVVNLGPSSAVGAIITLTLPPGASYQDVVLPPNWYATPNPDNTVTLTTTEILLPGASAALLVHVDLDPAIQPGSSIEFSGEVSSLTPDQDPTQNHATADTSIIAAADLAIHKTGPATLLAGAQVTYIITAENRGPSIASVRDLKDALPAGIALQVATLTVAGEGVTACVDAICQVQRPITVGEVITMTVVGVVDPALAEGAVLTNTATIFAENLTPDPDESNNQAQHAAPVTTLAQIGIDKYDLTDPVAPDGLLVYVLVVTNTGPGLARNVVITDTLPPHVTYHSTTGACTEATPGVVACTVGDLAVGARTSFLIVVKVDAMAPNGVILRNTAALSSTTPLTASTLFADEPTRVVLSTGPEADLEVVKTTDQATVQGGGEVTFTLTITNHGPSPVRNAQLLDLLPAGLTLVRVQTSQGFCNAGISCLLGALDFGVDANGEPIIVGTATVTVVARAGIDLADGVILTNTAYVQSELTDPQPGNNLDDAAVTVSARYADVAIVKTGARYATAGEVMTYTLTVINRGPATAENVIVSDPMPAGVRFVAATPAPSGGALTEPVWTLGALATGATVAIQLVVQVDPQAPAALVIVNTANVTSTTPDIDLSNNLSTWTTQSYGAADLEVIKTADHTVVFGDETILYTITVNNHGPSLSDRVDIKELIPPGTELTSIGASQGVCVNAICQVGNIPVGEAVVITAAVHVISPTFPPGTVLTNTAAAFTNTPDPNPNNNTDGNGVMVGPVVNLAALKTSVVQTATVGTVISFTLTVTNYGPSDAPSIVITDHLPYRFSYLWSTAVNGCRMLDETTMRCDAGPLAANHALHVDAYFFIDSIGHGTVRNVMVTSAPGAFDGEGETESSVELPTNPTPTSLLLETYTLTKTETSLIIQWKTVSEFRTVGFRLWRSESPDRAQAILLTPDMIPAHGVDSFYAYEDFTVRQGVTYWYWLEEITIDGGGWEYSVLSGRIGDLKLYLPAIGNGYAQAADAPAAADVAPPTPPTPTETPTAAPTPTETPTPAPTATPSAVPAPLAPDTPTPIDTPTATPVSVDGTAAVGEEILATPTAPLLPVAATPTPVALPQMALPTGAMPATH